MKRFIYFLYGVSAHAGFLAVYAYLAGFVGNFLVPKSIDSGQPGSTAVSLAIDLGLLLAFSLPHSIMARAWFKSAWTRIVPEVIERSTYVWTSNLLVALLVWQWRPLPTALWDVQGSAGRAALTALFAAGWLLVPVASLLINHFDLFGTRQVWLHLRGKPYTQLPFRTPLFYRWVRHPLYVGWMIAFWATPTMTVGHLLLAGVLTGYMLVAAIYEERDLLRAYGESYAAYLRRVPGFIPRLSGQPAAPAEKTRTVLAPAARVEDPVGR